MQWSSASRSMTARRRRKYLRGEIVPRVKQAPGFVAGYWVRVENGDQGRGTIVFESEDAARAVAEQIQQDPGRDRKSVV